MKEVDKKVAAALILPAETAAATFLRVGDGIMHARKQL